MERLASTTNLVGKKAYTVQDVLDRDLLLNAGHRLEWKLGINYVRGDARAAQLLRCLWMLSDHLQRKPLAIERILHARGKVYLSWADPMAGEPGMCCFILKGEMITGTRRRILKPCLERKMMEGAKVYVEHIWSHYGDKLIREAPTILFQTHATVPGAKKEKTLASPPANQKKVKERARPQAAAQGEGTPKEVGAHIGSPERVGNSRAVSAPRARPVVHDVDLALFFFCAAPDGVTRLIWRTYLDAEGVERSTMPEGRPGWYPVFAELAPEVQYTAVIGGVSVKALEVQVDWTQQVVLKLL